MTTQPWLPINCTVERVATWGDATETHNWTTGRRATVAQWCRWRLIHISFAEVSPIIFIIKMIAKDGSWMAKTIKNHFSWFTSLIFFSFVLLSFSSSILYSPCNLSCYRRSYSSSSQVLVLITSFWDRPIILNLCLFYRPRPSITSCSSSISCPSYRTQGIYDNFAFCLTTLCSSSSLYRRRLYRFGLDCTFWILLSSQHPWDRSKRIAAIFGFSYPLYLIFLF